MSDMSNVLQLILLVIASGAFLVAFWVDLPRLRHAGNQDAAAGKTANADVPWILGGVLLSLLLLFWRAMAAGAITRPVRDFFDAFLVLGLMLVALGGYFRFHRTLETLALFLLPMAAAVILIGGILGVALNRSFHVDSGWSMVHLTTILAGSACFAAGCVAGIVYLLADRQLRHRGLPPESRWIGLPPLGAIERFLHLCALLGFALLSMAIVAGIFVWIRAPQSLGTPLQVSPKLILAGVVWVIYGLLLHVRFVPVFRGTTAAWLSIAGFVALLGVYVAVNGMPK